MFDCAKRDVFKIKSFSGSLADLINNNNDCNSIIKLIIDLDLKVIKNSPAYYKIKQYKLLHNL